LVIIFTHFEAVQAPDLDVPGRKSKLLEGLSTAIQGIDLPKAQKVLFERTAESKAFFLSSLNVREDVERTEPPKVRPQFNEYQIADALRGEIEKKYRRDWSAPSLERFQYKIMEALTNWIGHAYSDGYPKRGL
jgi:hypothetical protein